MTKRSLLIPVLIVVSAGAAYTIMQNTVHEFSKAQCPDCHAVTPVKGKRETLRMTAPVPQLCGRCHENILKSFSHPVEIVPAAAVLPTDFPLSREGKMTCSTCHDIHGAPLTVFSSQSHLLRRPVKGAAFCTACHSAGMAGVGGEDGHEVMIGTAHMKYKPDDKKGERLDPITRGCLTCHDGSIGPNDDIVAGAWEHGVPMDRYDPKGSHPIGVSYKRAMIKHGGLHPPETLNPVIKLIGGKVGCGSCHDPFSRERKKLVMSNVDSRLCLACHDK